MNDPLSTTWLPELKAKLFEAVQETCMAAEFAGQTHEALEFGAFHAGTDSELDSAESALMTARSLIDEASEIIESVRQSAGKEAA